MLKKICCSVIAVYFLFVFCSCGNKNGTDTSGSANGENLLQSSKDGFLDFSDNNYKYITKKDVFGQDDNYYYLKQKVSSKDANINFDTFKTDVKDSCGNQITYFMYMDDKYGYYCRSDEWADTAGEIGRVNIEDNTYEKLIDIPIGNQGGGLVVSEDYIIWQESLDKSNWYKTRLNIYNIEKKTNKTFFNHSIDINTGKVYAWNFSDYVIDGDMVYFDDVVGIKDQIFQVNLYSYNAKTGEISLVKEMAKRPMKTDDGIIWQELNKDKLNSDICLYKNQEITKVLSFINNSCKAISVGKNGSIVITNWLDSNGDDYNNCNGVQFYNNNNISQLLVTKDCVYVEKEITDGNVILFGLTGGQDHKPIMFHIKSDKFIELECQKGKYNSYISNSYGYFVSATQDGMEIIRMTLSQ